MSVYFNSLSDLHITSLLKDGAIGIIPTDTVYGLVCAADNEKAVQRLYGVKSRTRQPGTTIAANIEQLIKLGFPSDTLQSIKHYWPNALSVEMSAKNIPDYLKAGQTEMAARIPKNTQLHAMLAMTGPLMTTSANSPHAPTATTIAAAQDYFGDEVDFYVDGGDLSGREPSTIIGVSGSKITVYRKGAVDINSKTN